MPEQPAGPKGLPASDVGRDPGRRPSSSTADAAASKLGPDTDGERGSSLWRDAWRRLRRHRVAMAGLVVLAVLLVACAIGPALSPHAAGGGGPESFARKLLPPSATHWFGTDSLGQDVFVRVLHGGRISLAVGFCATLVSLTIGIAWGAVAGFVGGKTDAAMMRFVDILFALPFTVFVILVMVFSDALARKYNFGATWNVVVLFAAIGAVEWLTMARIVRGQVMALRRQEFIEAAFSLGLRTRRIIVRHMIPNVLGPVIVYTTLTIPAVILREAFLSFLGLGVQAPMSSWGTLIKDGADKMEEFPWLLVGPGAVFVLTLFSLNFLGDGLRDALDVRAAKD
jgi:oligopeptide transport system permease protein